MGGKSGLPKILKTGQNLSKNESFVGFTVIAEINVSASYIAIVSLSNTLTQYSRNSLHLRDMIILGHEGFSLSILSL